jgi:hypothetical protein
MLAGNMKLRNFVILVIVAIGAIVAAFAACHSKQAHVPKDATPAPAVMPAVPQADAALAAPAPSADATTSDLAPRAWDDEVLAWRTKTVANGKGKDVHKGVPYKINVYEDTGHKTVNRVKVDANRNDKFDDKYTFKDDGSISLERAPADDEHYSESYIWNGAGWTRAK